ncbi:transcriptional regulator [Haloarchaeobius sp. HRN-SO-5]|uniref:transcriptional regulator n=1 Tax=Haloarchaeobius sp. HRN-SO-5 TaxID=3446118 RepID=UPI003EBF67FE
MREADETTRRRMTDRLRDEAATPSTLAAEFEVTAGTALGHVEHISRSLEPTDEELLAAPPECRDCGFTDFDDLLNRPSRCPACKSEAVTEPTFVVE